MMSVDRIARLAALLVLLIAPAAAAEPPADPRLDAALERLASEATYDEAIELLEAVLADAPGERRARLHLARVLSWRGEHDRALDHYDRLIDADPDDLEARVERAEVHSWRGQYARARAGFSGVLERDPANARALRGLARTERWAGELQEADRLYRLALEEQDDAEARDEWRDLRAAYRPRARLRVDSFWDGGDFSRTDALLEGESYLDLGTRLRVSAGTIRVAHDQDEVALPVRLRHDDDSASELRLWLDRRLGPRFKTVVELGARAWRRADDTLDGAARLEYQTEAFLLTGGIEQRSHLDYSQSFEALQHDVDATAYALTTWKALAPRWSFWGRLRVLDLSDGNRHDEVLGSLTFVPERNPDLKLSLNASLARYADPSELYYDPDRDLGVGLLGEHALELGHDLHLDYGASLGWGSTDTRLSTESGMVGLGRMKLGWERREWRVELGGEFAYSRRDNPYRGRRARLLVERRF